MLMLFFAVSLGFVELANAQFTISGKVLNRRNQEPVDFAVVAVPASGQWASADAKGQFTLKNIPAGKVKIVIQYLGFVKKETEYIMSKNLTDLVFFLDEDNLTLSQVEITAKKGTDLATSFVMDRKALDHLQMQNVTDVQALLPGGKTSQQLHLATTSRQYFQVNGNSGERGNPAFGVGLEVDGIRITNNSLRSSNLEYDGPDTKNISTSNIESIEIITGIPSVEHGDMTNGMVKINTLKGISPYLLELQTRPNTKQVALSKGINLGDNMGVLNFNLEHTKSISSLASPYTSYQRNGFSISYNNTLNKKNGQPITLNIGITGNVGGYNSEDDPDLFVNTYTKVNDNVFRTNFSAKWLLNKPWITSLEASGNINYNDKLRETSLLKSATASTPSIRTNQEGYHVGQLYDINPNAPIILIPRGFWYEKEYVDNKLINYNARLKANWFRKIGKIDQNLLVGVDLSGSGNTGKGNYYDDLRYAPTWREYRYDQESFTYNYAFYAEDALTIPINKSSLQLVGGIRSELTSINGSEYGNILNWSPRANAKYIFWEDQKQLVEDLSIKVAWGKTVKLPGFDALYPTPFFRDILTFAPGTTANGDTFYAYYTMPRTRLFNPDLKWQSNTQREITLGMTIAGNRVFITAAQDKTTNPYISVNSYEPFYYKFSTQANLEASTIPSVNRIYTVNQQTGIITVTDKTGAQPAEDLSYTQTYAFMSNGMTTNGSSVTRSRITWTVDFKQIKALRTSLRVDGNYYYYKGLEETVSASIPNVAMADGKPYKYIGFFIGGARSANGEFSKSMDMNLTITTHIPALRLIFSARLEGSFYKYSQNLSEQRNGKRGFVLDGKDAYEASTALLGIYGGNHFVGLYPDYYTSLNDPSTKIPFTEKLVWAKANDPALYNELAKMIVKTPTNYYFNKNTLSNYYSANFAITKEIGRFATLSFFANNFFNNMAKVRSTWNSSESSLFNSSYIPDFNYGATLKLKL
ncbi:carboxypeptidase-like regulatory domain-containing protein [Pedobacter chitinilyticus]|uniref:TonB-dependent receptor n=1 Tax=Pedobacter chitinilyticus TaxID=2233776 RepID=A0A3S3PDW7_9SPHI|nr:carboxypeptidase-like regulatory domain-containing protein [Pedobacter chitinilyticus]RWU10758.1 TonB-dependent receptor [Pedobacter chitinilyticus]